MKLVLAAAAVSLGAAVASTIAQAVPTPAPDVTGWLTGSAVSVLAFGIISFVRGWIVPGKSHDRVIGERDQLAAELREYNRAERAEVIPLMTRNTEALARVAAILAELERGRA